MRASMLNCAAVTALFATSFSGFASAQSAPSNEEAQSDRRLGTITVTATKREESLQDVPVAVTALSGELLEQTGVGSVEALASAAPSVTFTQSTNDQNNSVNIRGIGTSVFSQGVEPSVSIVIDDVVLSRQAMGFQDLVDVERVEILRGPQSTLFGKNASAGVISVTTAAPDREFGGRIQFNAAEDDEYGVGATITGPLSETVSGRLTGYYKEFDGHIDNADGRTLNGYENYGLRGKLLIEPSSNLDLTLIGDYRESKQDCCVYTIRDTSGALGAAAGLDALLAPVVAGDENADANVNAPVFNDSDQVGLSLKADYDFGDGFTFTSISAARDYGFENNLDVDALNLEDPQLGFITFDLNSGTTDITQYSQEFRITSPQGNRFDYVLGAYGFLLDLDRTFQRRFEILIPVGGGNTFQINQSGRFDATVETTNLALFGSGNYYLTEDTTLFGGLRVINETLDYTVLRDPANVLVDGDGPFGGTVGTAANLDDSTTDTALTGEIGLRRNFTDNVQGYVRYARGYKGRAIDAGFGAAADVEPIEAETSDAFEAGLKSTLANGNLILNVALFHTQFDDFQEQATVILEDSDDVLNAEVRLTNVGSVETTGIEIEAIATPTDTLTIQGGISYTDASIDEFNNADCFFGQTVAQGCVPVTLDDRGTADTSDDLIANLQDLSGGDLPNAPDWRLTGSIRQDIPLPQSFDGFVQVSGRWQSEVNFSLNGDPRTTQDSFAIVNLAFGITDDNDRYTASIFVNNVFDEFYSTNIFGDPLYAGVVSHYVPRDFERYVGARLGVNF
ncbi:MAG: TonB-dependent receptor [Pseudomonadota bacterium]